MSSEINSPADLQLRGRLSFLLKDTFIYGFAVAISRAMALITFPILARHFSVTNYGVLDYFMVLTAFLTTMFVFGQDSAVARFFYEYQEKNVRRQIISQSLLFQIVSLIVFLPLFWMGGNLLSAYLVDTPERVLLFKIVLLHIPFTLLINFSQNLLKWTFSRIRFLIISLGFSLVHTTMLVISVLGFDIGVKEVLLVSLATNAIFGFLGFLFVRQWLVIPQRFVHLKEMLPFAIPYGVICVFGAFTPTLERTMISGLLTSADLGLYAVATKISMLIGLLISAFQTAWGPFSLSLYKNHDAGDTYNMVLKLFTIAICVSVLILSLLAQSIIDILATARYSDAATLVFPLSMGLAIQSISWITEIGISISRRSYLSFISSITSFTVTLAGIWYLASSYGLLGVGMGVLLGHLVKGLMSTWLAQIAYPLPWDYSAVAWLIIATLVIGIGSLWIGVEYGTVAYNISLMTGLLLILIHSWVFLFKNAELNQMFN